MTPSDSLAIALFIAPCVPLAVACGLADGGLGGVGLDATGQPIGDHSGVAAEAGADVEVDAPSGFEATDDAPQTDATVAGDGGSTVGDDGGPVGEAGPSVEAGRDASGASDAQGDTGTGATDDGSAATTCDFDGTWGSRLVVDVSWTPQGVTGIIISPGSGTITQWLLSTRTQNGSGVTERAVVCGINLPDFQGTAIAGSEVYGVRFPDTLFDNAYIPAFTVSASFSGKAPGSTYTTSAAAVLLGLTLSNPTSAPWPATITTEVDMDQDGHPGVTADTLNDGGYAYPPVDLFRSNRADELYLAIRQVTQLSATATDCDHLTGTVSIPSITDPSTGTSKAAIDSHVIGCQVSGTTTDCTSTQASFVDNTQPVFTPSGASSFTSIRLTTSATCASVRQALP
jgi:hypothetical protein